MIYRALEKEVEKHLKSREITLIVGPRQVGKTTLMKSLERKLKDKGEKTLFLNLDIEEDRRHLISQRDLLSKIRLEIGESKGFVFIDEIQRKENAGLFLKGLYDMNLPYKFIVSGSGSLELKERIKESLVGRKRVFELDPVDIKEFINFRTEYKYSEKFMEFTSIERKMALSLLTEYLNYGGYPRVVLADTHEEKLEVIREIFSSYIDRDIGELVRAGRVDAYSELIRLIAVRAGNLLNLSEMSSLTGMSIKTLKTYLWYGEHTFVLRRLNPFFTNRTKEMTKKPIYYFVDLGLMNFAGGRFGILHGPLEFSIPFQNLVFNILRAKARKAGYQLGFWRTKEGAEVDFVLRTGEKAIPFEVKFREIRRGAVSRSMRSFIKKYKPEYAFIISLSSSDPIKVESSEVRFITVFDLIHLDLKFF